MAISISRQVFSLSLSFFFNAILYQVSLLVLFDLW